jgi:hypothetical protein
VAWGVPIAPREREGCEGGFTWRNTEQWWFSPRMGKKPVARQHEDGEGGSGPITRRGHEDEGEEGVVLGWPAKERNGGGAKMCSGDEATRF